MKTRWLIPVILATLSVPALAQPFTPNIDQRQWEQERRIDQGVATGQLTPREAARLEHGQDRIRGMEYRAKADGVVTPRERVRIQQAQDVESQRIFREKHDRQRRF